MTFPTCSRFWKLTAIVVGVMVLCSLLSSAGLQFYEDGMDSMANVFVESLLADSAFWPTVTFATGKWVFLGHVLNFLYASCPKVNWYAVMFTCVMIGACVLFLLNLEALIKRAGKDSGRLAWLIFLGTSALLFSESLFVLQYTRIAFFLGFFGLLLISQNVLLSGKVRISVLVTGTVAFAFSAMIRFETALLSLMVVAPVVVATEGRSSFRYWLKLAAVPMVSLGIVLVAVSGPFGLNEEIKLYNRFLHNTDGVRHSSSNLGIRSLSDSLAYDITMIYYLNDPEHIDREFIDRIGLEPITSSTALFQHLTSMNRFRERIIEGVQIYSTKHFGFLLFFLCSAFGSILLSGGRDRRAAVLVTLYFLVLAFLMAGYLKVEARVFNPIMVTFSLVIAVLFLKNATHSKGSNVLRLFGYLVMTGIIWAEANNVVEFIQDKHLVSKNFQKMMGEVMKSNDEIVVIDIKTASLIHSSPFRQAEISSDKEFFAIDNGILFVVPEHRAKAVRLFGGTDLDCFWTAASQPDNNVVFVADRTRSERIVDYFNRQYGLSLSISPFLLPRPAGKVNSGNADIWAYKVVRDN